MKGFNFTPGPWWRDDDGFIAAGSGDSYVTIADFDCTKDLTIDEREANKTLAIAVHDLLAVLQEFTRDVEANTVDSTRQEWPDLYITYRKALKAIEYATISPVAPNPDSV